MRERRLVMNEWDDDASAEEVIFQMFYGGGDYDDDKDFEWPSVLVKANAKCMDCGDTGFLLCAMCKGDESVSRMCDACSGTGDIGGDNGYRCCETCDGEGWEWRTCNWCDKGWTFGKKLCSCCKDYYEVRKVEDQLIEWEVRLRQEEPQRVKSLRLENRLQLISERIAEHDGPVVDKPESSSREQRYGQVTQHNEVMERLERQYETGEFHDESMGGVVMERS
jgi:hypothetical protein